LRIVLWGLILAVGWTLALAVIAHSPGLHSTPGMWLGVFGLPGVGVANWAQSSLHKFSRSIDYSLMLLVNWAFYCSVIQGFVSMKGLVSVKSKMSK
jgi:hypothetical protein